MSLILPGELAAFGLVFSHGYVLFQPHQSYTNPILPRSAVNMCDWQSC